MKLWQLAFACKVGPAFGVEFDRSLKTLEKEIGTALDIKLQSHRDSLFKWLNAWGCRQFAKSAHGDAGTELARWATCNLSRLPSPGRSIQELSSSDLTQIEAAFDDLRGRRASLRENKRGASISVEFGPTGAAKICYALRPNSLPMWDDAIRKRFGHDGSGKSYGQFILQA